jgi:hypothetical protein
MQRPVQIARRCLSAVAPLLILCSAACGGEVPKGAGFLSEIRLGVLAHDPSGLLSGFRREHGTDLNGEMIFSSALPLFGGVLRPAIGGTLNLQGDTSKLYAYGRWEYAVNSRFFIATGLGLAWHDGYTQLVRWDRKALGSHLLFHIPLEAGLNLDRRNSLSVYFDHMSNAYLKPENEGMDTVGIRYGIRF